MIRLARDFRLIPVVILATVCLFALKVSGLVFDGGYTLAERLQGLDKNRMHITTRESVPDTPRIVIAQAPQIAPDGAPQQPWAREMFNFGADQNDITGSVEGGEKAKEGGAVKTTVKPPEVPQVQMDNATVPLEPDKIASAGERAVLGRLQDRRKELDARAKELDMRESLLKAAEKRLDGKLSEIKDLEGRVKEMLGTRDKNDEQRFKSIVAMYDNMKSKDAARILERLDMRIQVSVASEIKPAKMSEILAAMTPEGAERLTSELARRADGKPLAGDQLPKIEGQPPGG